jgi:hypothetical protein
VERDKGVTHAQDKGVMLMIKTMIFLTLTGLCVLIALPLYAQIVTPGLYHGYKLPSPKDPNTCQVMELSQAEVEYKEKAETYMGQGKSDRALEELKNIPNAWVSHWFISYFYEIHFDLHHALGEVGWLIQNSRSRELEFQLQYRKESIEEAIVKIQEWEERHKPQIDKDEKALIE